jgi:hypothetical protein
MADKGKSAVAEAEPTKVEVGEKYISDPELDARFGNPPNPATTLKPSGQIVDDQLTQRTDTKNRLTAEEMKLSAEDWLRMHFQRIAGSDVQAEFRRDKRDSDRIFVEIASIPGQISAKYIDSVRSQNSLPLVNARIGRGFLSGFLPELREYGME